MKNFKCRKAQQLIEFLLVAPFIIIILGILTEYAYALNINLTLSQGLKTTVSSIYSEIKPGLTESSINTLIQSKLKDYLSVNNVPILSENNINVSHFQINNTNVFMATYTYIPAFTLPNVYFNILPEEFNFFSTTAVPSAFLGENNYDSSIDSQALDGIWAASNFSSLDSFDSAKRGIMKSDDSTGGRSKMLFLVPNDSAPGLSDGYALVSWSGTLLKDGSNTLNVDLNNGVLYTCSTSSCSVYTSFSSYLGSTYSNIIMINDGEVDLSTISSTWISPAGSSDLSQTSVNGNLKLALALVKIDISGKNILAGNYDNLDVSSYDAPPLASTIYKMESYGTKIFIAPVGKDLSRIKG